MSEETKIIGKANTCNIWFFKDTPVQVTNRMPCHSDIENRTSIYVTIVP